MERYKAVTKATLCVFVGGVVGDGGGQHGLWVCFLFFCFDFWNIFNDTIL